MRTRKIAVMALCIGFIFGFAGCGDDDDSSSGGGGEEAGGGGGGGEEEKASFAVCFQGSRDLGVINMLEAIDRMNADGYDIEAPFVAETEVCTDGIVRDEFQVGTGISAALAASEAGADNLRVVGARTLNNQLFVAQSGLTSCDDLDGKSFAIHSTGSVMTALFRRWKEAECSPDTEIEEVVIAGSGNRTNAIIAGEVDATGVEFQDEATLELNYGGQYEVLARFIDADPDFISNALYANTNLVEEHPEALTELLRQMTVAVQEWVDDPEAFREAIGKHLPDLDAETTDYFVEQGAGLVFPVAGGITDEALAHTIDIFTEAGTIEGSVTADDIGDLSHLEAAMDDLGVTLSVTNE